MRTPFQSDGVYRDWGLCVNQQKRHKRDFTFHAFRIFVICSPRNSYPKGNLVSIWSKAVLETQMPPGSAMPGLDQDKDLKSNEK